MCFKTHTQIEWEFTVININKLIFFFFLYLFEATTPTTGGITINLQSLGSGVSLNTLTPTTTATSTNKTTIFSNTNQNSIVNIQQAVPLLNHQSANTSFHQVLKQFSAVTNKLCYV